MPNKVKYWEMNIDGFPDGGIDNLAFWIGGEKSLILEEEGLTDEGLETYGAELEGKSIIADSDQNAAFKLMVEHCPQISIWSDEEHKYHQIKPKFIGNRIVMEFRD
jgi:hypothetical protein